MLTESLMQSNGWRSLALALTLIGGVATIIGSGGGGTGGNGGGASSFTYVRSYGSASGSHSAPNAKPTPDGGAVIAALEYGLPDAVTGGATASLVVTKTDSAGDVQWSRAYGQPLAADIPLKKLASAAPASDGGVFVAGVGLEGATVVKLGADGQLQWLRTYGAGGLPRTIHSIATTDDGGFVLGGWAEWARSDGSGEYSRKGWILKAGPDGAFEHQRIELGAAPVDENEIVNRVRPNGAGGYMLTGVAGSGTVGAASFWIAGVGPDLATVLHSSTHTGALATGAGADIVRTSANTLPATYFAVGSNRATGAIGESPDDDSAAVHLQAQGNRVLWDFDAGTTPEKDLYVAVITEPSNNLTLSNVVVAGNVTSREPPWTTSARLHVYPREDFESFGPAIEIRLRDWFQLPDHYVNGLARTGDDEYVVAGALIDRQDFRHTRWVMKLKRTGFQPLLWSRTFDDACGGSTEHQGVLALAGGDLLVTAEGCLRRLNAAGNTLWVKTTAAGPGVGPGGQSRAVVVATADGGALVAAPDGWGSDARAWLLRLDARGDVTWEKRSDAAGAVGDAAEVDGGFVLVGETAGRSWLRKITPSGDPLWARSFDGIALKELVAGRDGLLLGAGSTLVKTDHSGALLWARRPGVVLTSLTEAADGGYFALRPDDPQSVVRLNADGSPRWSNRYAPGRDEGDRWLAVRGAPGGGAVLAGQIARTQSHCSDPQACLDVAVAGIDAEGAAQWARTYGTGSSDWATSLAIDSNGAILVAALSQGFQFPRESTYVIRADAQGRVSDQCPSGLGDTLALTVRAHFPLGGSTETVTLSTPPPLAWVAEAFGHLPRTPLAARACIALKYGPTASFSITPVNPSAGTLITFDASGSRDDGPIARYEWDFQDDGSVDATGVMAQFSYTSAGVVRVRLRVTDADGATDEATRSLTIGSAGQTATFTDATFADTDWTTSVYQNGNGGTLSAAQQTSGGNPGAYRLVTLIVNPGPPGARSNIFAFHWHTPSRYDPASSGAIATIDYSEDALGPGVAAAMVLRQGGNVYFANPTYHVTAGAGWNTAAQQGLTAADFVLLAPDLTQSAQRPDFSATASPIEFGFLRALTSGLGCCGAGGPQGVDNWRITVHR